MFEYRELYKRVKRKKVELGEALEALVEMYVANRGGHDAEFISCITPPHRMDAKPGDKVWAAWDRARRALGEVIE
jgi:hypothetical protein